MKDKQQYIDKFASKMPTWRIREADKAWYKERFQWRLVFDFRGQSRNWGYTSEWGAMLHVFHEKGFKFRRRAEYFCSIFTSESELLDLVLANTDWVTRICELEYAGETYLNRFNDLVGVDAVTDIKFVKRMPAHPYQITFDRFDWHADNHMREGLTEYLITNRSDFVFKGYEQVLIDRWASAKKTLTNQWGQYQGISNGFKMYAKHPEDIMMLHMIAPGKIGKIIKLMEKNK